MMSAAGSVRSDPLPLVSGLVAGGGFVVAAAPAAVGLMALLAVTLVSAPLLGFYKRASP